MLLSTLATAYLMLATYLASQVPREKMSRMRVTRFATATLATIVGCAESDEM
jgi:hypothetical protein